MIKSHSVRTHASGVGSVPKKRGVSFPARARVAMLLSSIYALMYLDRINLSAAGNAIKGEFGWSNAQLGMAFSGFSWAYLETVMFGGWAARRCGPRIVLFSCAILLGLATIGTAFAAGALSLFMVRLLVGTGEGPAFRGGPGNLDSRLGGIAGF